jgi:hypothetical protein
MTSVTTALLAVHRALRALLAVVLGAAAIGILLSFRRRRPLPGMQRSPLRRSRCLAPERLRTSE